MRKTFLAVVCCLIVAAHARAAPIAACPGGKTYADYITLQACLLGDKAFSNFDLRLGPNTGAATTPKPNQIAVAPIAAAMNPGLQFTGTPPFHSPPPPGPPAFFSYRFLYDVRVQAGGFSITDASLTMPAPVVTADGSLTITELICLGAVFESKGICANSAPMVTLNVFDTPTGVQLMDSANFAPQRLVGTETLLIADLGTTGSASVTSFTEQFSESQPRVVAEPASFALLTCSVALLAPALRRRRRTC